MYSTMVAKSHHHLQSSEQHGKWNLPRTHACTDQKKYNCRPPPTYTWPDLVSLLFFLPFRHIIHYTTDQPTTSTTLPSPDTIYSWECTYRREYTRTSTNKTNDSPMGCILSCDHVIIIYCSCFFVISYQHAQGTLAISISNQYPKISSSSSSS